MDKRRKEDYSTFVMRPEELAAGVESILAHSPAFPGRRLIVDIIANPKAGGFKRRRFALRRGRELADIVDQAKALPKRSDPPHVHLHLTQRGGHAAAIVQRLVERSESNGKDCLHLIITAGGDGTSLETAERLVHLPEDQKDRFAILRLPFGTGNDGSEGRELHTALGRFLGPLKFERKAAIHVLPAADGGIPPLYAFNIASVGLDAYVGDMTNRLKIFLPGDSYKFWVNIATIFYDKVYDVVPMGLKAWDEAGKVVRDMTRERLFVAMGSSGNRQYGSNKKILPDGRNAVEVFQTSLLRKLMVKAPIESGRHEGISEISHFDASRIEISYSEAIPLQCDGETHSLASCDFPLVMERIPDLYNVIVPA